MLAAIMPDKVNAVIQALHLHPFTRGSPAGTVFRKLDSILVWNRSRNRKEDRLWYKAHVVQTDAANDKYRVKYVGYGSKYNEWVCVEQMLPLNEETIRFYEIWSQYRHKTDVHRSAAQIYAMSATAQDAKSAARKARRKALKLVQSGVSESVGAGINILGADTASKDVCCRISSVE